MDKQTHLLGVQDRLVKETEWTEFAKLAKDISKEQGQFALPSSHYSKNDELHLDETAKHLMPSDSNLELVPVPVVVDGKCLFQSIALVLFGDEDHHYDLKELEVQWSWHAIYMLT